MSPRGLGSFDGHGLGGDVFEHALQGDGGEVFGFGINFDLVDNAAGNEFVEAPEEMFEVDAVHGGAEALDSGERTDGLVGMAVSQSAYQVDFGANGPVAAGGGVVDRLDDEFGAAGEVGVLNHFPGAFGVDENFAGRIGSVDVIALLGGE